MQISIGFCSYFIGISIGLVVEQCEWTIILLRLETRTTWNLITTSNYMGGWIAPYFVYTYHYEIVRVGMDAYSVVQDERVKFWRNRSCNV